MMDRDTEDGGLIFWMPFRAKAWEKRLIFEDKFKIRMNVIQIQTNRTITSKKGKKASIK